MHRIINLNFILLAPKFYINLIPIIFLLFSNGNLLAVPICKDSPASKNVSQIDEVKWNNCEGIIYFKNGYTLKATFIKGKPIFGVLTLDDRITKYEGEFLNYSPHGKGKWYFKNFQFQGSTHNSVPKEGTITYSNGIRISGKFIINKKLGVCPDGNVDIFYTNGEEKKGFFDNCENIYADPTNLYESEINKICENSPLTIKTALDMPVNWNECKGTLIISGPQNKNIRWNCEWKFGKCNGQGSQIIERTNEIFIGKFNQMQKHGKGIQYFNDGRVLVGEWKNNTYIDGTEFASGEYKGYFPKNYNKQKSSIQFKKPSIRIISNYIEGKEALIEGIISADNGITSLSVNELPLSFDKTGKFSYTTFIPRDGKKLVFELEDTLGVSNKVVINLKRKNNLNKKKLAFAELNPLKFNRKINNDALAVIIGISKYKNAPNAIYADRDANFFADFAESFLGIKKDNIKLISNEKANINDIKTVFKIWMKGSSTPNQSDIYIFFAGHGLASTDGKELYLLPYDGEPRLLEDTALLRSEIFNTVKSFNPKSVTVFLDACYSGQTREKDMILADARPIAIVPIESDVPKNFTVFSASSGSEISGSLPEADHGLFSYFLMKGLEGDADANNDKKITNGELHSYVRSNVTRQAVRLGREQTPQLQGDKNRVLVEFN